MDVHKIVHGTVKVDREVLFSLSPNARAQGHPMKLKGWRFGTDERRYVLTQRKVKLWNLIT